VRQAFETQKFLCCTTSLFPLACRHHVLFQAE
jgi:hypothetical protein